MNDLSECCKYVRRDSVDFLKYDVVVICGRAQETRVLFPRVMGRIVSFVVQSVHPFVQQRLFGVQSVIFLAEVKHVRRAFFCNS